jgi:hypothetical protein
LDWWKYPFSSKHFCYYVDNKGRLWGKWSLHRPQKMLLILFAFIYSNL